MWKDLIIILAILGAACGATLFHCQEDATCQLPGDHLETKSFDFLSKFSQKQFRTIVSLTMSNASVNKVDPKLKYLKNLQYLDLSHNNVQISSIPSLINLKTLKLNGNNLKNINMTALPKNIGTLDISNNLLLQIPRDWRSLKQLKTLHLYKNPVDCDCNNVLNYDQLVKSGIAVPESVTCHSPKKYTGKDISAVNCSLDDIMQYDEPDLGSGNGEDVTQEILSVPFVQEDDDVQDNNTLIDDKLLEDDLLASDGPLGEAQEEEGSGSEGSGFGDLDSGIIGCFEDCSTPGPIGANDEEHASPLPSPVDQARIFLEDINPFHEDVSTTERTSSSPPTSTPTADTPIVEPAILKAAKGEVANAPDRNSDVEIIANGTRTGELERASAVPQNSTAVYAIIGVGLFLVVIFTICFIKKRQEKKRNYKRRELPTSIGEEMKPLSKPVNEKPVKNSSNIPEHVPLINGQNGKPKDDSPVLKTFTPLAHPETVQEEPEEQEIQNEVPDDVEIRQKPVPELLTPQRERVTIKETEIPDSIPKTPLLVHRQRNSDGEIVTTLVP